MCKCPNCGKDFETTTISVLDLCQDCFFEAEFKNKDELRNRLANELEEDGEMLLDSDNKQLNKIGEKLKHYAVVVEKL